MKGESFSQTNGSFFPKHYRIKKISQFCCSLIFLFDIKREPAVPEKEWSMMISFLQKTICDKIRWLDSRGNDGIILKKGRTRIFGTFVDMIFARSLDLAHHTFRQFIGPARPSRQFMQGIFSVSPSPRNFFRFCKPPPPPISTLILL